MLLIKNCKVLIDGEFLERSILVGDDGKIRKIAVGSGLKSADADEVIDAAGKHALPGLIDMHVHCREPGMEWKDDFRTASMAAAAGGVTTIFDMPNTKPATTTVALLEEKRKLAAAKCIVNYGLYIGATAGNSAELKKARNTAGVKLYMGSTTGELVVTDEEAIKKVLGSGKIVVVHAEDEKLIRENTEKYRGQNSPEVHAKIRSNEVAARAVREALRLAGDCKAKRLHITH
ncbi:MAG TPA: amidohydrolase family protein, partial [Candidatus Nanoarchaeia archaeon]|nr:amidohydrolase family protein [Candidatus Nanoarchaeia archaeon]